jgi:uncharacterized protein with HEPN domain
VSARTDEQRLGDIVAAITAIREHEAYRFGDPVPGGLVEDAVKYRLVEIGEAVGDLSQHVRDLRPDIPWSRIKGMRDLLAHRYHAIDIEVVWSIVDTHLGPLERAATQLLEQVANEIQG